MAGGRFCFSIFAYVGNRTFGAISDLILIAGRFKQAKHSWEEREMQVTDLFIRRELECKELAQSSRDPESKAAWNRFAMRWHEMADRTAGEISAAAAHSHARKPRATPCIDHQRRAEK